MKNAMYMNFPNDTVNDHYNVVENNRGNIIAKPKDGFSDTYFIWAGPDRCEFKELKNNGPEKGLIRAMKHTDGFKIQFRATQALTDGSKERNLIATAFLSKRDLEFLLSELTK